MAAKDRFGKAGDAARAAQQNRYLQRLIEDEELRSNLLSAYVAARSAYGRMSNGKPATPGAVRGSQAPTGAEGRGERAAASNDSLREPPKRARRRGGLGRSLLLLAVGAMLAIALSEGLRSKVLDLLFGAEEEFDYSATTAPETPAPAAVAQLTELAPRLRR